MWQGTRFVPFFLSTLIVAVGMGSAPGDAYAQLSKRDSSRLVDAAKKRQSDFELFRQSRIPITQQPNEGGCDQRIGRICIWFGGDDEASFPEERPEVGMARVQVLELLLQTAQQVRDPWVIGQQVHYLAEAGNLLGAQRAAETCGIEDTVWCSALLGYALHLQGKHVEAEAAFREVADALDEDDRKDWLVPKYVLTKDAVKRFEKADENERARMWESFWRLSDPLYLVDGNDRLTDHYARWVEARNQEDAENSQGMFWEDDLEETLVRYGRIVGYSRSQARRSPISARGRFSLQDTRNVIGHHHPRSRGYLFPEEFIESPADIPPESWITAPREARTWYAPPYAPDMRGLDGQVGRFRRGDEMLVVAAYGGAEASGGEAAGIQSGLFLVPTGQGEIVETRGTDSEGVFTLLAAPGQYVSSLEVLDTEQKRAWRARQGVRQDPLAFGMVAVSDLLILEPGSPLPDSLAGAIPHVRKNVRLEQGERVTVVWEVYGLRVSEPARVSLGFTRGRPGFLERVGDFLGIIEPEQPVEVTFEDAGTDDVQTAFRAIRLELPDLEPGEYTLHLRLELPGRTPVITSRPIVVGG